MGAHNINAKLKAASKRGRGLTLGQTGGKSALNGSTPVLKGAALTVAKPNLAIADAEGAPDNSIAAITNVSPFGFSNAAEAITILYKIQNLVTRVGELESRLQAAGIIA